MSGSWINFPQKFSSTPRGARRTDRQLSARITRRLRLPRDHGLIRKRPNRNRYHLSDNGVIQSTHLGQVFRERKPKTRDDVREATVIAAERRVRLCLMTPATTILALVPVLISVGRGSDVMAPNPLLRWHARRLDRHLCRAGAVRLARGAETEEAAVMMRP
ncbi:MAG: hypothetical protein JXR37_11095 [Kiritimatiellae bacterium]|nr:hypothetical protein [Kiritimatiellia bacterium]